MKLRNHEIEILANVLFEMKLKGRASRMRTRLIKQLTDYIKETLDIERQEILKAYAKKDEDGEILLNEDKTQAQLVDETAGEFQKEMISLMNEEFIIEENESNRQVLVTVGNALLDCELEFEGQEAVLFDSWCEQFEEVIERYESKEES